MSESVITSDIGTEITGSAPSRSVRAIGEEMMRVRSHDKPIAYQVFLLVVNARIFSCVAHPLEQRRFSSIRSTDNKDTKAAVFGSEFCSFLRVDWSCFCSGCGEARGMRRFGGSATGGDEGTGGCAPTTGEGTGGSASTIGTGTGGSAPITGTSDSEFEWLWCVLCDPNLKAFFSRLRNPLDSLAVCWRLSAISMRVGNVSRDMSQTGNELPIPDFTAKHHLLRSFHHL